ANATQMIELVILSRRRRIPAFVEARETKCESIRNPDCFQQLFALPQCLSAALRSLRKLHVPAIELLHATTMLNSERHGNCARIASILVGPRIPSPSPPIPRCLPRTSRRSPPRTPFQCIPSSC